MEYNANGSPTTARGYVESVCTAARKGNYFPNDKDERRRLNESLLKTVGYGLASYPEKEIKDVLPTIYSSLIVVNSLNQAGVVIDAVECANLVREGIAKGRADG